MFKKNLLKKAAIIVMAGVMSLSLVACDKDDKDDKKDKKTTTENTAEDFDNPLDTQDNILTPDVDMPDIENTDTQEPDVQEGTEGAISTPATSGTDTIGNVSFVVPEGYTKDSSSTSSSATYVNSEGSAFVVAADNLNSISESDAISQFDTQIKNVFGTQVTNSSVSYSDFTGTEWVTDAADGSYKGRSLVICDGNNLIYIEYVSYVGNLDPYYEIVESVQY